MKFFQATSAIAALAAFTSATTAVHVQRSYDCGGPYLIAARGSGEPRGEGVLSEVVSKITGNFADWKGSSIGLDYPAVINNNMGNYPPSVQAGIKNLTSLITSYVGQCGSSSSIVLLGYSQGAQVVSATLGGGEHEPALSSKYTKYSTFGDISLISHTTKIANEHNSQSGSGVWRPYLHRWPELRCWQRNF